MHKLLELKEMLMEQLEQYSSKELSVGTLDVVDKLAHAIKNLDKIIESYEEEEYSNRGGSYEDGGRGGNRGGMSYRYDEGRSYARGRGRNARRDSMGRYSRERGYSRAGEEMVMELRELMEDAPDDKTRQEFESFIRKIEQM